MVIRGRVTGRCLWTRRAVSVAFLGREIPYKITDIRQLNEGAEPRPRH
jgi:hypothetical protein